MDCKVIVPQIGQSIAEATIVKWMKQPGDRVQKGEALVEIGTDKINTELPAPESGVVSQILVPEGETVPVETVIAILGGVEPGAAPDTAASAPQQPAVAAAAAITPPDAGEQRYSPFVRKLAREHNVELSQIRGTGAGGRVTREDVMRAVEVRQQAPVADASAERVPMSRIRKLIARHMAESRRTAADVSTFFEVDMTEVARQRDRAREQYLAQHAVKLTYLPFVVAAAARALKAFPVLNSSIEGEDMIFHRRIHIGIAVALDEGLMVPVLRDAGDKDVLAIAKGIQDLSDRARTRRLSPEELQGGTFTITNPGAFGALMGTPIIHQPQVAILGVGAVVKRPVIIDDAIAIRAMAYLSLSYDHRALDGATADRFLAHIKNTLETECPSPDAR